MRFSCKTITILVATVSLSACVKTANNTPTVIPTLASEYVGIETWRKGNIKKCTDEYNINVDNLKSSSDFRQIIQLMDVQDGLGNSYYVPKRKNYSIEVWKCPNNRVQVEGYLKRVKQKYPEAIINND